MRFVKLQLYAFCALNAFSKLSLNSNKSHLAFSMDSGAVGVVNLGTKEVVKMKTGHESVRFVFLSNHKCKH